MPHTTDARTLHRPRRMRVRLRGDQYCSIALISLGMFFLPSQHPILTLLPEENAQVAAAAVPLIRTAVVPIYQGAQPLAQALPQLTAESVYVMDRQSGTILFERNANDRRYPASTAKLMTAMTARTVYQADDVVEVSATARAVEGTAIGIQAGEHYRVRDLLAASLIPSANDAAQALADHYREGNEGFLQHMNAYALHLHLSDSHFANASGLDSPQQYVTARDLGILAHEVMKDELLRTIVGTRTLVLHDLDQRRRFSFTNTHELLGVLPGVIGVKTGTTQSAGENLITDIQRNGHEVLLVVLGSRDRYRETRALVDWVFSAYRWEVVSFDEMAPQALQ